MIDRQCVRDVALAVCLVFLLFPLGADAQVPAAWWSSNAGRSEELLHPWTAMRVHSDTTGGHETIKLEVWGRSYSFSNSPFPTQIVTAGRQILAAPVELAGVGSRGPLTWNVQSPLRVTSRSDAKVILEGSFQNAEFRLSTVVTAEFDGVLRFDLALKPLQPGIIRSLQLRIPLNADVATLRTWWPVPYGDLRNSGACPSTGERLPFKPYYWLGNEDLGLAWFAESDQGWAPEDAGGALELAHRPGQTVLQLHLRDRAMPVDPLAGENGLSYSFGIQATPVKPFPPDWHSWRIAHGATYGLDRLMRADGVSFFQAAQRAGVRTLVFHNEWTDIENYPVPANPRGLDSLIHLLHRNGMKILLYFGYEFSTRAPEFKERSEELLVSPRAGGFERMPEQRCYLVCYRSAYANMLAAGVEQLIKEHDIDGVYLDSSLDPWGCTNTLHGCGYRTASGDIRPTYPIWAVRDLLRRLYVLCASTRHGMVNIHASSCPIAPLLTWATSYWDGEQIVVEAERSEKRHLLDLYPLDAFRAENMGRNLGVPAEFLTYADPKSFTTMDAIALGILHDVPVRPSGFGSFLDQVAPVWKIWEDFGIDQAVMYPYWKDCPGIHASPGEVKVTVHRHPTNGALISAVSTGNTPHDVTVDIDLAWFGLAGRSFDVIDAYGRTSETLQGGRASFTLQPMGFKVLWLRPK